MTEQDVAQAQHEAVTELIAVVAGQQRLLRDVLEAIDTGSANVLAVVREQLHQFLSEHGVREVSRNAAPGLWDAAILAQATEATGKMPPEIARRRLGTIPLQDNPHD